MCDISLMDAENDPEAVVKTTALNSTLVACGETTCCPFGYDCVNNGDPEVNGGFGELCVVKADQSRKPPPTAMTTSGTGLPGQSRTTTGASSVKTTASGLETTANESKLVHHARFIPP